MKETSRHLEAYEYFFSLGDERSLIAVSNKFNVSVQSLCKWNKLFEWPDRIKKRNHEIANKVAEKHDITAVEEKYKYRRLIKAVISRAVDDIKSGILKVETMNELERLVKLDLLLMGEPTEITQVQVEEKLILIMNVVVDKAGKYMEPKELRLFASDLKAGMEIKDE